jgi:hypothetical protein
VNKPLLLLVDPLKKLYNISWVQKSTLNTSKKEVFIKLFTTDLIINDQDIMEEISNYLDL